MAEIRNPIDAFIRDLGGPSKVAGRLGLRASTVNSWQLKGRIPIWRMGPIMQIAAADGVPLPQDRAA